MHKDTKPCYYRMRCIVFLISLMLHLLLLLLLFITYTNYQTKYQEPNNPERDIEWASTNPATRNQSSVLLFSQDRVAVMADSGADQPSHTDQDEGAEQSDTVADLALQQGALPDMPDQQVDSAHKSLPAADLASSMVVQPTEAKPCDAVSLPIPADAPPVKQEPDPKLVAMPLPGPMQKNKADRPVCAKPRLVAKKRIGRGRKKFAGSCHASEQQTVLGMMAESWAHQARDTESHVVTIIGNPRGLPTAEQIKRERYIARLQECLHVSCRSLQMFMPHGKEIQKNPVISMTVHKDGSMSNLRILESCEHHMVDQFYLNAFRDASRSFPPLPSYFVHDYYIFNWIIIHR